MEEKEDKELYMPRNCPPLDYIIKGITGKDFTCIGICAVVALVIAINIVAVNNNVIEAVFILLVVIGLAIIFFMRDQYGENCLDKIKIEVEYYRSPKEYLYEYVDVYEKLSKKMEKENGKNRSSKENTNT